MNILCICHANICRSFMAQEFLKQLLPGTTVFSRGLYADPTYEVPQKVKTALAAHNIPFTAHTSTQFSTQDLAQADLIFCMEQAHADYLLDRYAQYTDKIWLLTDFAFDTPQDLPDPIGLEGRAFAKQANRLYEACQAAAVRIKQ
ncbi:MAG: hypothetical protein J6Q05_06465 [Elusimicrobiaceae bacterium]|nr:hypothetical protein [Elusimicrobiaceae bacterium]